jgi:flagellar biosynthesis/type III secretory pathway chaperone
MMKPATELENILKEQRIIYGEIYDLEEKKTGSIMDRSGSGLEKISLEQERLLERLSVQEKKRATVTDQLIRINKLTVSPGEATLGQVIRSMNEDQSNHLMNLGLELKEIILKLQRLQSTNEQLIRDNMDFFHLLLSGIKSNTSIRSGYDSGGRENKKVAGPILFNKTA